MAIDGAALIQTAMVGLTSPMISGMNQLSGATVMAMVMVIMHKVTKAMPAQKYVERL